jgi:uncharacterized protein YdhG (YjbR/CyaY superfamily)
MYINLVFKIYLLLNMVEDKNIDSYLDSFSLEIREVLVRLREIILSSAPNLVEGFSYGMPVYKYKKKPFVYFAAYKNHIGLYATPNTHEAFKEKLSSYKQGKGSVQFPLSQPIPFDLIKEMLIFRRNELDRK